MRRLEFLFLAGVFAALAAIVVPLAIPDSESSATAAGIESPFPSHPIKLYPSVESLGEALFFDGRLSGDTTISCATCHQPDKTFTDGLALSNGFTSTSYFRNTPTLLNAGRLATSYWDGRIDGSDLSTVVRDHLIEAHFMASDARILQERMRQIPEYEQTFIELMGGEASFGKVRSALVAYLESLRSENNPYLNFAAGDTSALSDAAQRGLTLFNGTAGCSTCHNGELLSDGQTHVTGVADNPNIFSDPDRHISFRRFFRQFGVGEFVTLREDLGEFALTHDDEDRGAFRTPSLLEVGQTAPYMHNGTLGTLEDVVKFYNFGGDSQELAPLGLTDAEINDLVAFLSSLQSDITPVDPPVLPDYEIRELGVN